MATSFLLIPHIVTGQLQAEVVANQALDMLERKLVNKADVSIAGTGTVVLDSDQIRDGFLNFTGALTGNRVVELPTRNMFYLMQNNTTGAFTVTIQHEGAPGTSLLLGAGYTAWIYADGTDIIDLNRSNLDYVQNISAAYTPVAYDRFINCATGGGGYTVTLPTPVEPGREILITRVGTNTITIARGGADTMNGSASNLSIATQWQAIRLTGETTTNWLAHRTTVA